MTEKEREQQGREAYRATIADKSARTAVLAAARIAVSVMPAIPRGWLVGEILRK